MGQIISALQSKGGTGKTTILAILADRMASDGAKVYALDTDPESTLKPWAIRMAQKNGYELTTGNHLEPETVAKRAKELAKDYDVVLVDTPGVFHAGIFHIIAASDLVLVPTAPSTFDLRGLVKTFENISQTEDSLGRKVNARVVLSRWKTDRQLSKALLNQINSKKLPAVKKPLKDLQGITEICSAYVPLAGTAKACVNEFIASMQYDNLLPFYSMNEVA